MSGPEIVTMGCRLNAFETEVMRARAVEAGLADAVIVNTCAVTAEAERQARQAIRRLRRERPGARLIVTGCAAQLHPEEFAAMPEVDRVLGNEEKLTAEAFSGDAPILVGDIAEVRETAGHLIEGFEGRARAFVQVQQGCDHRCSFCVVPQTRGPARSIAPDAVVEQVRRLTENGYREAVLTGVDVSSYDWDGLSLGGLVRRILDAVPELSRLRLTSLDPAVTDEALFDVLAGEERLAPHLHLSLQSLDDMILRRMNRRHDRAKAAQFVARARAARPDAAFGCDLIAGFPTEDEDMFRNTLDGIGELGLTHLHVFPYSSRPGTPAERMPQVPAKTRKDRAARLRAAGRAAMADWLAAQVGTEVEVLAEQDARGRTALYADARLDREAEAGALVKGRVVGVEDETLLVETRP